MILNKAKSCLIILIILGSPLVFGQSFSVGTNLGGGIISSNSPTVGSFTSSLFIEGELTSEDYLGYRLSFFYTGDFAVLLPGDNSVYYPFIKGATLKLIYSSNISDRFYFEQGLGGLVLNDRVYSDRDNWGYGFAVSVLLGKDMRDSDYQGIKLGVGAEYGLTFIEFSAYFITFYLQLSYTF
jgi:hypothetical protein